LDIQVSVLGAKKEISVGVAEGTGGHGSVDEVDVQCNSFTEVWVAGTAERVKTVYEVCFGGGGGKGEGCPFGLFWQKRYLWVEGEETIFDVGFGGDFFVAVCLMLVKHWKTLVESKSEV
jgi:hypothetical protein